MKHFAATALGLLLVLAPCAARADVVTDWNKTAIDVMKTANVTGNPWSRALAMVHVAMSDAINTVQGRYAFYVAKEPAAPAASAEAAAVAAARHILIPLFPNQKAMVEAAYAASMRAIPDGPAKNNGVALGERVAVAVQADRAADGTDVPDTYRPITAPGVWVPDDAADFRAVCARETMGAEERRPVPAQSAAVPVERALRARLQRDQESGRHQEHGANTRANSGGEVLDPDQHQPRPGSRRRASFRPRRDSAWVKVRACSHCSAWASPTPSSPIGMRNSPTTSGVR